MNPRTARFQALQAFVETKEVQPGVIALEKSLFGITIR
jgi:hypothetical protein